MAPVPAASPQPACLRRHRASTAPATSSAATSATATSAGVAEVRERCEPAATARASTTTGVDGRPIRAAPAPEVGFLDAGMPVGVASPAPVGDGRRRAVVGADAGDRLVVGVAAADVAVGGAVEPEPAAVLPGSADKGRRVTAGLPPVDRTVVERSGVDGPAEGCEGGDARSPERGGVVEGLDAVEAVEAGAAERGGDVATPVTRSAFGPTAGGLPAPNAHASTLPGCGE